MNTLPKIFRVRQNFPSHCLDDVAGTVLRTLDEQADACPIRPGDTVAIAVGSRGVRNLPILVKATVDWVRDRKGVPVIVPAMGSHGGATAQGQKAVLAKLGIDDEAMGCAVRSEIEPTVLGSMPVGEQADVHVPICCDAVATASDHVIIINRVKPHTRLVGSLQSGLVKMLLIGLGKNEGAKGYHRAFAEFDYRLDRVADRAIEVLLSNVPIRIGLAVVEDAFDDTCHVEAIPAAHIIQREPELLTRANDLLPGLPFESADLLIVDQIGKEISGCGMDTNVIGRKTYDKHADTDEYPKIEQIYVRSLTEMTAGNATGIGIAEFCRSQVAREMDQSKTWVNCLTSRHVGVAAIPMHFETDREVLEAAVTQARRSDAARWMWIVDTLRLSEVGCSEAYWDEARTREDLEVLGEPMPLEFGPDGQLGGLGETRS